MIPARPSRPTGEPDRPDRLAVTPSQAPRRLPTSGPSRRARSSARPFVVMTAALALAGAVLAGAFVTLQSLGRDPDRPFVPPDPSLVAIGAAPTPKPWSTRHPAGTQAPDKTKPPAPTERPDRTPRPRPSVIPYVNPGPSVLPDGRIVYTLRGDEYDDVDIPGNGTFTERPDGSVTLETTRDYSYQLVVTYALPEEAIPAGTRITRVDTRVCGSGDGDFWETYGPEGGDTLEHEVSAPGADGCWHYSNAPGFDTSVIVIIRLQSKMTITKVEYTVTVK